MTMARDSPDLERLIEEGLTLYGQGDLDGALLAWERVLAEDPEHAQAISYVDYVRLNYELLTTDPGTEDSAPFAIAEDGEPEYQIEISPGELEPSLEAETIAIRSYIDALDEGWAMDDDATTSDAETFDRQLPDHEIPELDPPPLLLELEADEPPDGAGISFEDATREYQGRGSGPAPVDGAPEPAELEFDSEGTPGFGGPQDFSSFGSQITDVRARDLGFVKPAAPPEEPGRPRRVSKAPELQMTIRTPPSSEAREDLDLPTGEHAPLSPLDPAAAPSGKATRDLPGELVAPSARDPLPSLGSAPTRDLSELGARPTRRLTEDGEAQPLDPVVSAPTRELGLRAQSQGRAQDRPNASTPEISEPRDGTRSDIVLPFDPIDARSAQILDEVDDTAPQGETSEDRTRRRISSLLERASTWSSEGELDRAVAAVDLALSEDPNSALAQKLIHRNREAIMGVFQGFLGELDRQPSLARPLHELANAPISPRAAFLLSRVDGTLTLDEILDVSGMPRLEAYRYLCQLFLRGILR